MRAGDKRAKYVGLEAYTEAGGTVLRDLFHGDDGGWLQDAGLLDQLAAEKLRNQSETVRAEGWKWVEVAPDFPYGHTFGLRQIQGDEAELSDDDQAARNALQAEYEHIEETYADSEELPEATEQRLGDIETALAVFDNRPATFEPRDIARAGAFVSIDGSGTLRIERGFVRPEDEAPIAGQHDATAGIGEEAQEAEQDGHGPNPESEEATEADEDDGRKPIPDRLMTELTAHRTLALRHALGDQPGVAFLAALHVLCLKVFYRYAVDSCLDIDWKSLSFGSQAPGLNDSPLATAIDNRHQAWIAALPKEPADLWDALEAFDTDSRQMLFAHSVSLSVNAVYEAYNRRPNAIAHADRLAQAVDLDMAAAGWMPTVGNYLGRVTKTGILNAVREAKGAPAGDRIEHLKKVEMAEQAADLLAGSGWLPEVLRTPGRPVVVEAASTDAAERAVADPYAIAAE